MPKGEMRGMARKMCGGSTANDPFWPEQKEKVAGQGVKAKKGTYLVWVVELEEAVVVKAAGVQWRMSATA